MRLPCSNRWNMGIICMEKKEERSRMTSLWLFCSFNTDRNSLFLNDYTWKKIKKDFWTVGKCHVSVCLPHCVYISAVCPVCDTRVQAESSLITWEASILCFFMLLSECQRLENVRWITNLVFFPVKTRWFFCFHSKIFWHNSVWLSCSPAVPLSPPPWKCEINLHPSKIRETHWHHILSSLLISEL